MAHAHKAPSLALTLGPSIFLSRGTCHPVWLSLSVCVSGEGQRAAVRPCARSRRDPQPCSRVPGRARDNACGAHEGASSTRGGGIVSLWIDTEYSIQNTVHCTGSFRNWATSPLGGRITAWTSSSSFGNGCQIEKNRRAFSVVVAATSAAVSPYALATSWSTAGKLAGTFG